MIRVCTRRATSRALGRVAGSAAQHLSISRRRPGGQSLQPPEALLLWLPPLVLCGKHPSAELSKLPVGTSLVPLPWDLWPEPPCCHLVHHQVLSSPSRSPVLIWAPTGEALPAASQSAGRRIGFGPQDATLGGGGVSTARVCTGADQSRSGPPLCTGGTTSSDMHHAQTNSRGPKGRARAAVRRKTRRGRGCNRAGQASGEFEWAGLLLPLT